MSVKKMKKKAPSAILAARGAAVILTHQLATLANHEPPKGTMACFFNYVVGAVKVCFSPSYDSDRQTSAFSVCLFFNRDMIACDHGATWEQAMGYILAVLSARTPKEAAGRYGELHPRFTADELIERVRLAKQAAA